MRYRRKILAREMNPGDIVYSPRTEQMMLILSNDSEENKKRIRITWMPLIKGAKLSSCDVDPDLIYHQIIRQKP